MEKVLNKEIAASVVTAAKVWSKGNVALVDALTKAREAGEDGETIDRYRDVFYAEAVINLCGLPSVKAALAELEKSPFDFANPAAMTEANRSNAVQRVFNAAKTAWCRAREAAGFEHKKASPKAKPAPVHGSAPSKLQIVPKLTAVPAVIASMPEIAEAIEPMNKLGDILNHMENVAGSLDAAREINAKLFTTPVGIVLNKAIDAFIDGVMEAWTLLEAEDAA